MLAENAEDEVGRPEAIQGDGGKGAAPSGEVADSSFRALANEVAEDRSENRCDDCPGAVCVGRVSPDENAGCSFSLTASRRPTCRACVASSRPRGGAQARESRSLLTPPFRLDCQRLDAESYYQRTEKRSGWAEYCDATEHGYEDNER